MRWLAAIVAGLAVGGITTGVLLTWRGEALAARGTLLQASLVDRGDALRTYYLAQQPVIQSHIETLAREAAEPIAQRTAAGYIGDTYGLTKPRIVRLQALAQRWT
jgi:uncharacterized membrane protein